MLLTTSVPSGHKLPLETCAISVIIKVQGHPLWMASSVTSLHPVPEIGF